MVPEIPGVLEILDVSGILEVPRNSGSQGYVPLSHHAIYLLTIH